jgi:hypothetical protein
MWLAHPLGPIGTLSSSPPFRQLPRTHIKDVIQTFPLPVGWFHFEMVLWERGCLAKD